MFARIRQFLHYVLPGIIRPLRVLWNQIIGFVFLVFAGWATVASIRRVREYMKTGAHSSLFHIILAGVFVALMLWFGISSFRRAGKISRSS